MTPEQIKEAREIIAAAERGDVQSIPMGKIARLGWSEALDEVERLKEALDSQQHCDHDFKPTGWRSAIDRPGMHRHIICQKCRSYIYEEKPDYFYALHAENEKLKRIEEAAFKYWNDVKDPMPHGAELYEALKAYRGWK